MAAGQERRLDDSKFCFIACVNDEFLYEESVLYLEQLVVPEGMSVDLLAVRGAPSMTAGYQQAMEASDARFKIYIHQDVFIVNKHLLQDVLDIFRRDRAIGMIGLAGAVDLPRDKPIWWTSDTRCGMAYNKKSFEEVHKDVYGIIEGDSFAEAGAIDGIFMATSYDLPWRTDLFHGWHFYDISQSREFINHGYKVVIARQEEPWVLHTCNRKIIGEDYNENMRIFQAHYKY